MHFEQIAKLATVEKILEQLSYIQKYLHDIESKMLEQNDILLMLNRKKFSPIQNQMVFV